MPPPPNPKSSHSADGVYVALLRGINVGGKNKLPMADLAEIFKDAGCSNVRTYIQSGNVVFSAPAKRRGRGNQGPTSPASRQPKQQPADSETASGRQISDTISAKITKQFGLRVPVVLRTAEELRRIVNGNPFLKPDVDPKSLHVAFLADRPGRGRAAGLDPKRSPGDSFKLQGREIYLHLRNGVARTKFTNDYFDATLATTSTLRNWRTVLKLVELAQSIT